VKWLLAVVATLAFAPAAYAQGVTVQGFDVAPASGRWDPPTVQVTVGATVTWHWDGTQTPHNVKSAAWSDVEGNSSGFTHVFTTPGEYAFRCQFHSAMTGTVRVSDASGAPPPPPPPPPPSEQWWQNDQRAPTVLELARDQAPRLSRVRAAAVRDGAQVRFRLSERARVIVRFKLAGLTIKTAHRTFRAGNGSLTVRDRRLSGRYRVDVFARDAAGNRSPVKHDRVTIR
jgi:plastocyanin